MKKQNLYFNQSPFIIDYFFYKPSKFSVRNKAENRDDSAENKQDNHSDESKISA